VDWFHPRRTRLNPRWTPSIAVMYLQHAPPVPLGR
jgi:hypothetical protein